MIISKIHLFSEDHLDEIPTFRDFIKAVEQIPDVGLMTKTSNEKTSLGKMLFSPTDCNKRISNQLKSHGWMPLKLARPQVEGDKQRFHYVDFHQNGTLVEVQFGKYFAIERDITRMINLIKSGKYERGIIIVPDATLQSNMNTGPGTFHHAVLHAIESHCDVPLLILGVTTSEILEQCA